MKGRGARRRPTAGNQRRLALTSLFLFSLFCLLIAQFYKIQIVEGDRWTLAAKSQHEHVVKEPFRRGVFFTNATLRRGHPEAPQPLVVDVPMYHLFADPKSIPPKIREEVAKELSCHLQFDGQKQQWLKHQLSKESRSRKLQTWLTEETRREILEWWLPFAKSHKVARNALYTTKEYKRSYPFGKLLGPVLHTVRDDLDEETGNAIPTGGLELSLNKYLTGSPGKRLRQRSPRHPLDLGELLVAPENGADVYLTINHHIQAIAEEEIEKAVKRVKGKGGWALMMDPNTGEVLALAQYPFFEPAKIAEAFSDPEKREWTGVKAVTDAYEPGSTFKPLVMAICYQGSHEWQRMGHQPFIDIEEKISTAHGDVYGTKHLVKDLRCHKYMNGYIGIQKSGNIYFAKLVSRLMEHMGAQWYHDALGDVFRFGTKTGIELVGETAGVIPEIGKVNPNGTLQWSGPTPYTLSMGHNIQVNGIQMARAFCAIANGGKLVEPTLVRKIVRGESEVLVDNTLEARAKSFPQVISPEIAHTLRQALKYTSKPGGTAPRADIIGYTEAGKSGTSEKIVNGKYSKNDHISTFIGMAPADNPRFVLMIALDEPEKKYIPGIGKMHHGGTCAAPVFRDIAARTLQYIGVEPDDPHGYPKGDPRYDKDKAKWLPETRALKKLYDEWNKN